MSMTAGVGTHKIRVAVAGCGEFGRNHVRAYREMETVELAGVFDQDAGLQRSRKNFRLKRSPV
jgi:predicted dehydrogenase